jgi:hypothetical protein
MEAPTPAEVALAYHERTKHYPTRFARALGYLDWANQPDPFRRFRGARRVLLPLTAAATARDLPDLTAVPPDDAGPSLDDLYAPRAAAGAPAPLTAPLTAASLGLFFELSLGVTAWKSYQSSRWALRANPSSGNLHPTEGYAILPELAGVGGAGVYHYRSEDHALEERAAFAGGDAIAALGAAPASFIVGLTSIVWRAAW